MPVSDPQMREMATRVLAHAKAVQDTHCLVASKVTAARFTKSVLTKQGMLVEEEVDEPEQEEPAAQVVTERAQGHQHLLTGQNEYISDLQVILATTSSFLKSSFYLDLTRDHLTVSMMAISRGGIVKTGVEGKEEARGHSGNNIRHL